MWAFNSQTIMSLGCLSALLFTSACSKEMASQNRPVILHESAINPDHRADLPAPAHAVAQPDPPASEQQLSSRLERGQRLYEIYCSECHDRAGDGHGMITERGFPISPPLAGPGARKTSRNAIMEAIANGQGPMPAFAQRLTSLEQENIARFVQVLQFSRRVPASMLEPRDLADLNHSAPAKEARP